MADQEIGFVELTATSRIIFSIGTWKGQLRGGIRKFLTTDRYAGPTKSGMSLDGNTAVQLLAALRELQNTVPTQQRDQQLSIGKSRTSQIRLQIVPPDENNRLPSVDIREFVESPEYSGPTKKGVRFGWDKLKQFVQLVEVLVQQLGAVASSEATLFPDLRPKWISEAKGTEGGTQQKSPSSGLDATTLKVFPDAFLPDGKLDAEKLALPSERLRIGQDRDGHYFVTADSNYTREVRNEVEGKFLMYAQRRGCSEAHVPKEMFKLFSTVVGYEKYCRELRQKLIRDIEARSGNRTLAEHMANEQLESNGLPIC